MGFRPRRRADVDVSAVFNERSVERGKSIALRIQILSEMLFNARRIILKLRGQAADRHAFGSVGSVRKLWRKQSVHEHQTAANCDAPNGSSCSLLTVSRASQFKRRARDRGNVGEAPVLIVRSGKAGLRETRECVLPQRLQPARLGSAVRLLNWSKISRYFSGAWVAVITDK